MTQKKKITKLKQYFKTEVIDYMRVIYEYYYIYVTVT